jgi:hypothetical protein
MVVSVSSQLCVQANVGPDVPLVYMPLCWGPCRLDDMHGSFNDTVVKLYRTAVTLQACCLRFARCKGLPTSAILR